MGKSWTIGRSSPLLIRTGHSACLWQGNKIVVYAGENEHRTHLSDVNVFDIDTQYWTQHELSGTPPRGRARHAAHIHDDKLFVSGGKTRDGHTAVSDDFFYLDLKTWTWSRVWRFVARYDHYIWSHNTKLWAAGGLSEEEERVGDVWWLDFQGVSAFQGAPSFGASARLTAASSPAQATGLFAPPSSLQGSSPASYIANSSSVQIGVSTQSRKVSSIAPGSVSNITFHSGPDLPIPNAGVHYYLYSSGLLLDFATPASSDAPMEISLNALDLSTHRWQKLADGRDIFKLAYRWHFCCLNQDGTQAWLLGSPLEQTSGQAGAKLSSILHIDLRKLGLLGNKLAHESRYDGNLLASSDSQPVSHLSAIGTDLARTFDTPPESGSGCDFVITAISDGAAEATVDMDEHDLAEGNTAADTRRYSRPIHVHRFLLSARWPHFARLYEAQMTEFHTKRMHIPEPYTAVRAFLFYLYTDSITAGPDSVLFDNAEDSPSHLSAPTLENVAGMLVMSSIYDMPRLQQLCVARLVRQMDIEHAPLIFERASAARELWLKRRAASFCMMHWGRIVRTEAFKALARDAMLELCEEVDTEARVIGADELEAFGGLDGSRAGHRATHRQGSKRSRTNRQRSSEVEGESHDEESMEVE